jgi:hypothetical protein
MGSGKRWTPFGHPRPPGRVILVFQVYLDDSGTANEPIITMAGFVAQESDWETLEPDYEAILGPTNYRVPVLHAKHFHATQGAFAGWSKVRKKSLTRELFQTSKGRVPFGISFSARKKSFLSRKAETGNAPGTSAYSMCFSAILVRLIDGPEMGKAIQRDGLSIFVESGNKNNDGLNEHFRKFQSHPIYKGALREISFIPKDHCRAIQVADFLAFYTRRHATDLDRFDGKFQLPFNVYHDEIERNIPLFSYVITDPFGSQSEYGYLMPGKPNPASEGQS